MNDLARERLRTLVSTYGRGVCHTPRSCEIFLHQECQDFPSEEQVLVEALRHGTVSRLLELPPHQPWDAVSTPLAAELSAGAGISAEQARWAVDSWALALGKHPNTAPPPLPREALQASEPPPPKSIAQSRIWPPLIVSLGGAVGAALATVVFTVFIFTVIAYPRFMAGRAGAIAFLVGLVLAFVASLGGAIGGGVGWLLIQSQSSILGQTADVARWRLVRGFLSTLASAAGATLLGGWVLGLLGVALGSLAGAFSGAILSGMRG
jgi:hypothetical protein